MSGWRFIPYQQSKALQTRFQSDQSDTGLNASGYLERREDKNDLFLMPETFFIN